MKLEGTTMGSISPDSDRIEIVGRAKQVSFARMLAFSGGPIGPDNWPARNLHTDLAKAQTVGLSRPIGSAIQLEGYVIENILDTFGEAWYSTGILNLKCIASFGAGDEVIPKIKIRSSNKGAQSDYVVDVSCETRDGKLIAVGEARFSV